MSLISSTVKSGVMSTVNFVYGEIFPSVRSLNALLPIIENLEKHIPLPQGGEAVYSHYSQIIPNSGMLPSTALKIHGLNEELCKPLQNREVKELNYLKEENAKLQNFNEKWKKIHEEYLWDFEKTTFTFMGLGSFVGGLCGRGAVALYKTAKGNKETPIDAIISGLFIGGGIALGNYGGGFLINDYKYSDETYKIRSLTNSHSDEWKKLVKEISFNRDRRILDVIKNIIPCAFNSMDKSGREKYQNQLNAVSDYFLLQLNIRPRKDYPLSLNDIPEGKI